MLALARYSRRVIADLVAANRAEPREQRGLAAVGAQLANRLRERHVHDLFDGVGILAEPGAREAIEAREEPVEELGERLRVVREHSLHEPSVVEWVGHQHVRVLCR
jgi:hypothetical protein